MKSKDDYINQLTDDLRRQAQEIAQLKKQLATALAGQRPNDEQFDASSLWCESGVNQQQAPFVSMRFGFSVIQMDVKTAQEVAANITSATEAALSDAFFVKFLIEKIGIDEAETWAGVLMDFRAFRASQEQSRVNGDDDDLPETPGQSKR